MVGSSKGLVVFFSNKEEETQKGYLYIYIYLKNGTIFSFFLNYKWNLKPFLAKIKKKCAASNEELPHFEFQNSVITAWISIRVF